MMNSVDPNSLERIVPDELQSDETTGLETLQLHLDRYRFAKDNLIPGSVLDIACGVGYGTALLSNSPLVTNAIGVDISSPAIQYATQRYAQPRVNFVRSDALKFQPAYHFENIVSLETIEHVEDPRALFAHLVSLLAPGGRLIGSVPVTPSVDANTHHKSNFSIRSFRHLGEAFSLKFLSSHGQVQPYSPLRIALRQETRASNLRRYLALFYIQHPSHFFLRLCSTLRDGFNNKYITVVWEKPSM